MLKRTNMNLLISLNLWQWELNDSIYKRIPDFTFKEGYQSLGSQRGAEVKASI